MRKVHEKSIILGIGIGMIITAIAGMIFSAGSQKELSKAEIISIAKGYGLIEQVQFLNGDNASEDSTIVASGSTVTKSTASESTTSESTTSGSTTGDKNAADSTATDIDSGASAAELTDKLQQSDSSSGSTATAERNIIITIKSGYKAYQVMEELLDNGIIINGKDFLDILNSRKALTNINVGTYKFKKNEDLKYIVKTICKLK